jgi:hypothetical protein
MVVKFRSLRAWRLCARHFRGSDGKRSSLRLCDSVVELRSGGSAVKADSIQSEPARWCSPLRERECMIAASGLPGYRISVAGAHRDHENHSLTLAATGSKRTLAATGSKRTLAATGSKRALAATRKGARSRLRGESALAAAGSGVPCESGVENPSASALETTRSFPP